MYVFCRILDSRTHLQPACLRVQLILAGAYVGLTDSNGLMPLHQAAAHGLCDAVQQLIWQARLLLLSPALVGPHYMRPATATTQQQLSSCCEQVQTQMQLLSAAAVHCMVLPRMSTFMQ